MCYIEMVFLRYFEHCLKTYIIRILCGTLRWIFKTRCKKEEGEEEVTVTH